MSGKVGRPSKVEEREIREKLQKFLPDIYLFYEEVFKSNNKAIKERVAKTILDKLCSDLRSESEILERLTALEQISARAETNV